MLEREPENAPGPFYVEKGRCIFCRLCEGEAPDLIGFKSEHPTSEAFDHCYFKKQPSTPEELSRAIEAVRTSCVEALHYAGSDPEIIRRIHGPPQDCPKNLWFRPIEIASCFAKYLDSDDYQRIWGLMEQKCRYITGTGTLKGRDAIIASYREHGERARKLVERIEYTSEVIEAGPRHMIVVFTDSLTHRGASHVYRLRQHLHFSKDGLIQKILHEDMPGEREKLTEFMDRVGIRKSSA